MCDDHLDTFTFFSSVIITPEISYVKMIYKIHGKKFVTLLLVSQAEKTAQLPLPFAARHWEKTELSA